MTTGLEGVGELISVEQGQEEEEEGGPGQVGETTVPPLPALPLIIVEVATHGEA